MPLNLIPYLYNLHKVTKNQWQDLSKLQKLQDNKLKALIKHAYEKVDYYRILFDQAGIKPEDIKSTQDIAKISITTRKEFQALPKSEIVATGVDLSRCLNLCTSGSTGMPLDIFMSPIEMRLSQLYYRRILLENGSKFTDRIVIIVNPHNFGFKQWFHRVGAFIGILKEKKISIFDDTESQLKTILEFKPEIIHSYASTLKNLAVEIEKRKIKNINPRIIFSTAESMDKQDKGFISSVFKSEIFDYYSSNECGPIAWECKAHTGYHINSDNIIVEFLKEDGTYAKAGEEGEIVITSLNSYTMPFIRYKLGDIGVPSDEQCPCGRTLPMIKKIIGRSNDYFMLPSGKRIYAFALRHILRDIPGISQYQMIQQKKDKVRINIVKDEDFSSDTIFEIEENCKHILEDNITIEINIVEGIPGSTTGKFHAIKSELNQHA